MANGKRRRRRFDGPGFSRVVGLAGLAFSAASLVSCGANGATETSTTTVTFEPASATVHGATLADGLFQCSVDMTLLAHGTADGPVFLETVTTTFVDSTGAKINTTVSAAADWFGVASLKPGDTAVAHRLPAGRGVSAINATSVLAYLDPTGRSGSATFTFRCTN